MAHCNGNDALGWTVNTLSESHKSLINGIFTHVTNGIDVERIELVNVSIRPAIIDIRKSARRRYDQAEFVSIGLSAIGCPNIVSKYNII